MKITIWSDFVCPFCYIGVTNLKHALETFEHSDTVDIEYKSYQLDPTAKHDSDKSYIETLAAKKGVSAAQMQQSFKQIDAMAKEAGLEYHFDIMKEANSLDAHRIFQFAHSVDKGMEFFDRLYQAVFTEGKRIDDPKTLIELSTEVGLDSDQVKQILKDKTINHDAVMTDVAVANQVGVQGVPFFVFNDQYGVPGAQPVEVFEKALAQIHQETTNS